MVSGSPPVEPISTAGEDDEGTGCPGAEELGCTMVSGSPPVEPISTAGEDEEGTGCSGADDGGGATSCPEVDVDCTIVSGTPPLEPISTVDEPCGGINSISEDGVGWRTGSGIPPDDPGTEGSTEGEETGIGGGGVYVDVDGCGSGPPLSEPGKLEDTNMDTVSDAETTVVTSRMVVVGDEGRADDDEDDGSEGSETDFDCDSNREEMESQMDSESKLDELLDGSNDEEVEVEVAGAVVLVTIWRLI
jgi:hypothetical protein